ncbi:MAG: LysR family transcriptional regulator [Gammaproteobacteria bacterium]|nr:LysR family transcriptional regulator [Gammaproteobacteria bacterium]
MPRLNYHHLYYFWRVAREGNLTAVAKSLHLSQSALSMQIKQLEESCGFALFERVGRRLELTDKGQQLLRHATDIFVKGEQLETLIKSGMASTHPQLKVGVVSTMSRNFIDEFVAPLLNLPDRKLSLVAGSHDYLLAELAEHRLDLLLSNTGIIHEAMGADWQVQLLSRQPVTIVGPVTHQLNRSFPDGFEHWRWVLPGPNTEIRKSFNAFCAMHSFEPNIIAESDDMAMLRLLARDSHGLAVVPRIVVIDEIKQQQLAEVAPLPNVFEYFYAVSIKDWVAPETLAFLYDRPQYKQTF